MRFYDSPSIERIGFDFYCDIANNIVKLREENGFTQKDLAKKTGIKEYRISNMENVKIRIDLDAVEELAKALNVSADYLTDAELDYGGEECLYQVWLESDDWFKQWQEIQRLRILWHSMPDRMHRLLQTMQSRNAEQSEWQRILRKSAEAQVIANMRMKE